MIWFHICTVCSLEIYHLSKNYSWCLSWHYTQRISYSNSIKYFIYTVWFCVIYKHHPSTVTNTQNCTVSSPMSNVYQKQTESVFVWAVGQLGLVWITLTAQYETQAFWWKVLLVTTASQWSFTIVSFPHQMLRNGILPMG